jgi:hypothetical protein
VRDVCALLRRKAQLLETLIDAPARQIGSRMGHEDASSQVRVGLDRSDPIVQRGWVPLRE